VVILLLTAICLVICASISSCSPILHVFLPHLEATITVYVDVVASAQLTILIVSNTDATIFPYANVSAMWVAICIEFSVVLVVKDVCFGLE
jgi:hypothetical protein